MQFFFLALAGTGTFAYFLGWIANNLSVIFGAHLRYFLTYVGVTSLISFSICYIHGPILNPRALHVLQWLLQGLSLAIIYLSVAYEPYGVTLCAIAFVSGLISFLCDNKDWMNEWMWLISICNVIVVWSDALNVVLGSGVVSSSAFEVLLTIVLRIIVLLKSNRLLPLH